MCGPHGVGWPRAGARGALGCPQPRVPGKLLLKALPSKQCRDIQILHLPSIPPRVPGRGLHLFRLLTELRGAAVLLVEMAKSARTALMADLHMALSGGDEGSRP